MYLFVGLATSKLLRSDLPTDDPSQPWLVDVAAELSTPDGKMVDLLKRTVRLPKGAAIQDGASAVHHISTRTARRSGAHQRWVCYGLLELLNEANVAVSFGDMTRRAVSSVIERVAGSDVRQWLAQWNRAGIEWADIRSPATQICKIERDSGDGYRWPSRAEAAAAILDPGELAVLTAEEQYGSAWHNMKTDKAIFMSLRERNAIEDAA